MSSTVHPDPESSSRSLMQSDRVNIISRVVALSFAAALAPCATADFTPYVGAQQNWPIARGAFVASQYTVPDYYGLPSRPYTVLGYLDATTAPVRRRELVEFAARRAKEIGGDAIVVVATGSQYVGTYSSVSAFTSGNYSGNYVGNSIYGTGYASTTTDEMSIPLFAGKESV